MGTGITLEQLRLQNIERIKKQSSYDRFYALMENWRITNKITDEDWVEIMEAVDQVSSESYHQGCREAGSGHEL